MKIPPINKLQKDKELKSISQQANISPKFAKYYNKYKLLTRSDINNWKSGDVFILGTFNFYNQKWEQNKFFFEEVKKYKTYYEVVGKNRFFENAGISPAFFKNNNFLRMVNSSDQSPLFIIKSLN